MRRSLLASLLAVLLAAPAASAAPGDLDETFSRDGLVSGPSPSRDAAVAVAPDGAVLVAGEGSAGSFSVRRYRADGSADTAFGPDGIREVAIGPGARASFVAVEPGGTALVAGRVGTGGAADLALARLTPTGTLDPSLGSDGKVVLDYAGGSDRPAGFDVTADGTVFVAGIVEAGDGDIRFGVARLDDDGSPDPAFDDDVGSAGWVTFPAPNLAETGAVAGLAGDGALVASPSDTSSPNLVLRRLTPAGTLDSSFGGGDGMVAGADLGGHESPRSIAAGAGRIDVGLSSCAIGLLTTCDGALQRFTADGGVHPASPPGGLKGVVPGGDVQIDAAGATIVAGSARPEQREFQFDLAVARVTATGQIDPSFAGGVAFADFGLTQENQRDLALAPDGRILVSGNVGFDAHALARIEVADGPPDADADGVLDGEDRCPARFSEHRSGCPKLDRSHQLKRRGKRLVGTLRSEISACVERQRVAVLRKRPGRDKRVARVRTNRAGRWKLKARRVDGRVYGLAKPKVGDGLGRCAKARSKPVRA